MDKLARLGVIQDEILRHGAPQMSLFGDEKKLAQLSARYFTDERVDPLYVHPGLCLTVLPHREPPVGTVWERTTSYASLLVIPIQGHDGRVRGVPYGSKARLILLYLMTEAVKARSRTVELGRSMHAWMSAMGVPPAGKNYRTVADQADRIEHCVLSFRLTGQEGELTVKDSIIRGAFRPFTDDKGGPEHSVELSEGFYQAIVRRPVPISEAAVRLLAEASGPLDAYLWLAYRLHVLEKATLVPWHALHAQFGAGTRLLKHFKPRFARDVELAKGVYPEARLGWVERGLLLQPSPPPSPRARADFHPHEARTVAKVRIQAARGNRGVRAGSPRYERHRSTSRRATVLPGSFGFEPPRNSGRRSRLDATPPRRPPPVQRGGAPRLRRGMSPTRSSRRRWSNRSTHARVANPTAPRCATDPSDG